VFDLLHPGHIALLSQAKQKCDRLIVALNSDDSTRKIRGKGHPIQHETARALVIASLADVDAVTIFQEDDPLKLIQMVKPDIMFKGSTFATKPIVGADFVKSYGGQVCLINLEFGYNSLETANSFLESMSQDKQ